MSTYPQPVEPRFWPKVNKTDTCWLWTAARDTSGYGIIKVNAKHRGAHRVSYELAGHAIPDGMELDHLCRVRHCVNPDHLEPVTSKENVHRGVSFAADNNKKTHCPAGHPYSGDNLFYKNQKGQLGRNCRTCWRAQAREYWYRKGAKPRKEYAS